MSLRVNLLPPPGAKLLDLHAADPKDALLSVRYSRAPWQFSTPMEPPRSGHLLVQVMVSLCLNSNRKLRSLFSTLNLLRIRIGILLNYHQVPHKINDFGFHHNFRLNF